MTMPRPKSKEQLIHKMQHDHDALLRYLETLTEEQMTQGNIIGEWSVKDVLCHLSAWEQMFLSWYQLGKVGDVTHTPAEGYTWRQIPELNQCIYEQFRHQGLALTLEKFHSSYEEILAAISHMSQKELFTPHYYQWTKSTTLGSYAVSATCSHYAWALKEIRRGLKATQILEAK